MNYLSLHHGRALRATRERMALAVVLRPPGSQKRKPLILLTCFQVLICVFLCSLYSYPLLAYTHTHTYTHAYTLNTFVRIYICYLLYARTHAHDLGRWGYIFDVAT